ncbi:hypothetical protein F2P81_006874 [Scophthalmus maximus]|uniref:Uncharacterized protein n=1 Tax=Scophthalmus maximus TaxID=52904 RepID=A0A6A4T0E9_SCOMX|nr:hypothetical protein F2P81_006874 [Scophthalmus maximus]
MAKVLETPIKSKTEKNYSLTNGSTAVSTTGCPPGKNAAFNKNPSTLPELPDISAEESSQREKTSASSQQKQDAAARTKPYSDTSASGKEAASVHAAIKPQVTAHTNFLSSKPSKQTPSSHQTPSPSQVNFVSVSVRGKSRERHLQGGASSEADDHLDSERQSKPFLIQAAPVRDEKRTDWSVTSIDSDTGFQVPRLSYSGRKVEPVKPFSVSASVSASDFREFGGLSPDTSDLTVYNDIVKNTPQTQNLNFPSVKTSKCREPTPGSEAKKQQGACPRPLFSELRQRHQDSGFDSPLYQQTGPDEGLRYYGVDGHCCRSSASAIESCQAAPSNRLRQIDYQQYLTVTHDALRFTVKRVTVHHEGKLGMSYGSSVGFYLVFPPYADVWARGLPPPPSCSPPCGPDLQCTIVDLSLVSPPFICFEEETFTYQDADELSNPGHQGVPAERTRPRGRRGDDVPGERGDVHAAPAGPDEDRMFRHFPQLQHLVQVPVALLQLQPLRYSSGFYIEAAKVKTCVVNSKAFWTLQRAKLYLHCQSVEVDVLLINFDREFNFMSGQTPPDSETRLGSRSKFIQTFKSSYGPIFTR